MGRSGANLALLLLGAFRSLAHSATEELARRGHPDYRATHDFAMQAIASGAASVSEVGRRLSVSKQAAAKTVSALQERGYVATSPSSQDGRQKKLEVTPLGVKVMAMGQDIFDELREDWQKQVGQKQIANLEQSLRALLENSPAGIADPGWLAKE